jgi:hypothetical protein
MESVLEVRMKQDRFLLGILVGIGVLIAIAIVVFFTRQQQVDYRSGAAPDDVVHNYVLALMEKDFERAYGYLAQLDGKPTFEGFRASFLAGRPTSRQTGIRIGAVEITGESAAVEIVMIHTPGDPFSSGYESAGSAQLVRLHGQWRISSLPAYDFWDFSWYHKSSN